jgi:hypothetical protein
MTPKKKITPLEMIHQAYQDAANAIEFCNWYTLHRPELEKLDRLVIIETFDDAIADAEMDLEHVFNGVEYWTINYKKPTNDN